MNIIKFKLLFLAITLIASYTLTAQVAINADGSSADGSAILDVNSTTKGLLPPRMTEVERDAISNPVAGLTIWCNSCGYNGEMQLYNGREWTNMIGGEAKTEVPNVTNPATGKTWMDRNLGASQVATSSNDANSYGDLYQWGRGTDGHENRNSNTSSTLSSYDTPAHGFFITIGSNPKDWRSPQNDNLWQGINGINNPCPSGYRLPTEAEWEAERTTWSSNDAAGAIASPLKLPVAGRHYYGSDSLIRVGTIGYYCSSTINDTFSRGLQIQILNAYMIKYYRASGFSVRCIRD